MEDLGRVFSDEELRRTALGFSQDCVKEGFRVTTELYNNNRIPRTAKELIDDAEIIFQYLKFGKRK